MEGRSKGNKTEYAGVEERWEGEEAIRNITLPLPTIRKKKQSYVRGSPRVVVSTVSTWVVVSETD